MTRKLTQMVQLLLLVIGGWVNRRQLDVIEYLQEENRILKARLGGRRLRFTDAEHRLLARRARALGRQLSQLTVEATHMNHLTENHLSECAGHAGLGGRLLHAMAVLLTCCLSLGAPQASAADGPLVLEKSMTMPAVPPGPYSDYLSMDLVGGRLFATPQAAKAVAVLDLKDGRVLKMIPGIGNPHGIFYSPETRLKASSYPFQAGGSIFVVHLIRSIENRALTSARLGTLLISCLYTRS